MTDRHRRHGQDGNEIRDLPAVRHEGCLGQDNHAGDTNKRKGKAEFELLNHFGHFDEEVGELGFLGRGAPGHVDFEHMREESGGDVQGETAKEDAEHENPFEVFEDWIWC